jgi:hypothetical protein
MAIESRACPTGCGRHVLAGHLMCAACWRKVPKPLQAAVHRAWRAWRRDLGNAELMRAHTRAADAAIGSAQ